MQEVQTVKSTYKAKDTEEIIDKIFYRHVGYVLAIASKALGLSPNAVTIISIFVGVAAGHFFYYESISFALFLKEQVLYFLFELTILNILFIYMVVKHEENSSNIYDEAVKVSIK